jgi:rRNA-processing protein CGR1
LTSYAKRLEARKQQEAVKEHEKELRDEKEAERQVRNSAYSIHTLASYILMAAQAHIQRTKDRRAAKEEKERYEKMAEKMHRKRVERLKRREKRNKLLNS